jgi:hypothetical protein
VGWHSRVIGTSSHLSKNCRLIRFLGLDELTYIFYYRLSDNLAGRDFDF